MKENAMKPKSIEWMNIPQKGTENRNTGHAVGIIGCSNGQTDSFRSEIEELKRILGKMNLEVYTGDCIYETGHRLDRDGRARARALMQLYQIPEIQNIFDISGGDLGNEILPYLDYEAIQNSGKVFWGYSDLTTVINAIYARTGQPSVLYQIRNLVWKDGAMQQKRFLEYLSGQPEKLFSFPYHFIRGEYMEGVVVGGNIRCFLKLAGTPYWPDLTDKILLLEAFGRGEEQMRTYLSQLKQIGAFEKVKGILLGSFTKLEAAGFAECMPQLVEEITEGRLPIAKTQQIGHGSDASAIWIGKPVSLKNKH
jgi:muramoyltetrapeptide carboxypeptidase LdcA involved in peptidoglycan recycling